VERLTALIFATAVVYIMVEAREYTVFEVYKLEWKDAKQGGMKLFDHDVRPDSDGH